jgi:esterase/lipase superfamily enzyme
MLGHHCVDAVAYVPVVAASSVRDMENMETSVTVYFGTNRQPQMNSSGDQIVDFGSDPGPISGYAVRFGQATVAVDLLQNTNSLVPGSLFVAPEVLTPAPGAAPQFGSRTIFDALRQSMADKARPTLVFIHGFSNSFKDAIERAGWISAFYAAGGLAADIFVFTWPSRGGLLGSVPLPYADYEHDRSTAAASGPAVGRTLRLLYDFVDRLDRRDWCRHELHLLCHSMGNYVLRNGVQAWLKLPDPADILTGSPMRSLTYVDRAVRDPITVRRTFDQVILAAADEDDDSFDDPNKLDMLPRFGNAVTVYHTRKDWVLNTLSSKTKFNGPRLGTNGPDNMSAISDKVNAIDVSEVFDYGDDAEGHQYYRKVIQIRDDIIAVLSGKRPIEIGNRSLLSPGRYLLRRP